MSEGSSPARTLLSTLPALFLLLYTVAHGAAEVIQSRLLSVGERTWPGYSEVRYGVTPPTCDPASFALPHPAPGDPLAGVVPADPLAGVVPTPPAPPADPLAGVVPVPSAVPAPPGTNPAPPSPPSDDPLAGVVPVPSAVPSPPSLPPADPLAGVVPTAPPPGDALAGALDDGATAAGPGREAIAAAKAQCEGEHARYAELTALVTPTVDRFRSVDTTLGLFTESGRAWLRPLLVVLLLLGAITATLYDTHIRLRDPKTAWDHRLSSAAQLVVNLVAAGSAIAYQRVLDTSGMSAEHPWVPMVWAAGLLAMAAINTTTLLRPPAVDQPGSPGRALLAVPLYTNLGFWAAAWFLLGEQHPAGLAIYLDKLTDQANLYLQVGLYVWAGMLLKQTRLAEVVFDLLRPWKLPPEVLAIVVVLLAAVPTAYSGASGIFVIAAGGTIYDELRRAGARNQLALAATAMSGSLGVVLSPCLLVVIVAALNKQVTTTELFNVGGAVFMLSGALFAGVVLARREGKWKLIHVDVAQAQFLTALRALLPYILVFGGVLAVFGLALDTWLNEHSAPTVLLVVLLGLVLWERWDTARPVGHRLHAATTETTGHIGALLTLMAFSAAFGGIVERSDIMSSMPTDLGGPLPAMIILTVFLVLIGMLMDPYGAVILVSATLAHVAEANGIRALHFWMTVLVAFELGYLTPPVALNQLLTAAVIGPRADDLDLPKRPTFFDRHERYLLPITVLGSTLLVVAFGPLVF